MPRKRKHEDPFHGIRELQDHRNDPGHFTGGNIHPLYGATRKNRFGYILIVMGGVTLAVFPWLLTSGTPALGIVVITAYSLLLVVAGIRLVRGPKRKTPADAA